jgi:hypothetical protein
MEMSRDRDALKFLADFKSIFSIYKGHVILHTLYTAFLISYLFAKKYTFYCSHLTANMHLGC